MKRLTTLTVLVTPGVCVAPGLALAQEATTGPDISYSYAELRYVDTDNAGGDGFLLGGSYDLGNNWLILGSLGTIDYNGNVDRTTLEIGGGYVFDLNEDFDIVTSVSIIDTEIDTPFVDFDDSGLKLSAGVRGLLSPKFEVRGSVNHVDLDNSDTYLEIGGDYYFTRQLAAGASVQLAGDDDLFTIGVRWFVR